MTNILINKLSFFDLIKVNPTGFKEFTFENLSVLNALGKTRDCSPPRENSRFPDPFPHSPYGECAFLRQATFYHVGLVMTIDKCCKSVATLIAN